MKKLLLSLLFALVLIPAGVYGTLYSLNKNGFFALDQIEIRIENHDDQIKFLSPLIADLNKQLSKYRGQSLWDLDLPKISQQLSSQKWISESFITRSWPSSLNVKIHPRSVKLLYISKNGKMFPVVEDGTLLEPVGQKAAPDVTLLQGDVFEKDSEVRKRAVRTITEIPKDGKFSQKNISELRFDSKQGFWATLIGSGMRIKLGEEQIALKSARVAQVIEYMETRQLEARVIDANLSKKVLVRLRKDP